MKLSLTVRLKPAELAEAFCELGDDDQAQFFIECARIAEGWEQSAGMQWSRIGRHLATCECSTYEAREMVRDIAGAVADG